MATLALSPYVHVVYYALQGLHNYRTFARAAPCSELSLPIRIRTRTWEGGGRQGRRYQRGAAIWLGEDAIDHPSWIWCSALRKSQGEYDTPVSVE